MEFLKTDAQHFVNNVELLPSGALQWSAGRNTTHFLILKTPIGCHPRLSQPEAQQWLSRYEEQLITTGEFHDSAQKISGVLLAAADYFRSGGKYPVSGGNICFFVYGAALREQTAVIFAMNNVGGDLEYCAERLTRVTVYQKEMTVTRKRGLFRQEKKRLLRIQIETNDVLTEDDLRYQIGGYLYPIPRSLMKAPFYLDVLPDTEITFLSRSNAKIEVKDG